MIYLYITNLCIQLRHVWRNFTADNSILLLHMGRFRSSLGSESKTIILKLLDEEFSYAKRADIIGVSKSCIFGFVKRYKISQHNV